jgi:mannose-1-phosphate guanylyltransferase/mannose-6-phosphate isomerase
MNKITPIILSGGSGSRLWPISRQHNPKQFLDFFGETTLFSKAILRTKSKEFFHSPVAVCNNEHRFIVAEEFKKSKIEPLSIILEPVARNTASAIAVACLEVVEKNTKNPKSDKSDLVLVMPSDHLIKNETKFIAQVNKAKELAMNDYLITFGIVANYPETGYGYIKSGELIDKKNKIFAVEKFVEKPKKELAKKFIESKNYFWNSGIFLFSAKNYLQNLHQLSPDVFNHCVRSYGNSVKDLDFIRLDQIEFEKSTNISIDYAVMEKAKKVAVMPIDVGWSDIGSWQAIADLSEKNHENNTLIGDVISIESKNCYINAKHGLIGAIGVENLIIVSLKDALLVANKNNSQDVKRLFEELKNQKRSEVDFHTKVLRPWGSFETLDLGERFKVKRISVNPNCSLSLQMHQHRSEHWIVVKGTAHVYCVNKEFILHENESTYIPVGKKHRLENKGKTVLEIIEIQTGNYLGEDDIIRFQDIYGR